MTTFYGIVEDISFIVAFDLYKEVGAFFDSLLKLLWCVFVLEDCIATAIDLTRMLIHLRYGVPTTVYNPTLRSIGSGTLCTLNINLATSAPR